MQAIDYIIDVRSPREFENSHIPNALNLPIFSNSEYEKIGTMYKDSPLEASFYASILACKNVASIIESNRGLFNHKNKFLIYCARGGKRSFALYSVLDSIKLRVERLSGGYKAYRNEVVSMLSSKINQKFLTLCGNTGCGKSELIRMHSSWSIDLEGLAKHYGSAFGGILGKQPSFKMFQNLLYEELRAKRSDVLLIESESKKLGELIIPSPLYSAYQESKKILIKASFDVRIERVMRMYKNINEIQFLSSLLKIKNYIGQKLYKEILKNWENRNLEEIASILLKYYDRVYKKINCDYEIDASNLENAYFEIDSIRENLN